MAISTYEEETGCEYSFILDSHMSAKNWGSVTTEEKENE